MHRTARAFIAPCFVVASTITFIACGEPADCDVVDQPTSKIALCIFDEPCEVSFGADSDVAIVVDGDLPAGLVVDGGSIRGTVADDGSVGDAVIVDVELTSIGAGCAEQTGTVTLSLAVSPPQCTNDDDCLAFWAGTTNVNDGPCSADADCDDEGFFCLPHLERGTCIADTDSCAGVPPTTFTSTDGASFSACSLTTSRCSAGQCSPT